MRSAVEYHIDVGCIVGVRSTDSVVAPDRPGDMASEAVCLEEFTGSEDTIRRLVDEGLSCSIRRWLP